MGISVTNNEIIVDEQELDIYTALELKNVLQGVLENGADDIRLDLSKVSSLSTPAAQVIVSAVRSFKKLDITGDIQPSLNDDLRSMGIGI